MMTGPLVRKGRHRVFGGRSSMHSWLGQVLVSYAHRPTRRTPKYGGAEIPNGSKIYKKSDKNKRRMNFKRRKPENAFGWRMRGFTCFEVR